VALLGCLEVPHCRYGMILHHSLALAIHNAEAQLG
jgi:hypothetical protein